MAELLGEQIEVRAATLADVPDISRIMNYPPEPPMARLLGSRRASRLGDLLVRAGAPDALAHTTVAVLNGAVAGVLGCGSPRGMQPAAAQLVRLVPCILVILGPGAPRAVYGLWLNRRLHFQPLAGAFPVTELYVDEALRNRGIGATLLQYAEEIARGSGAAHMSVETGVTNPARHLYERQGYQLAETKTNAAYERLTGSPGRVLLSKDL